MALVNHPIYDVMQLMHASMRACMYGWASKTLGGHETSISQENDFPYFGFFMSKKL